MLNHVSPLFTGKLAFFVMFFTALLLIGNGVSKLSNPHNQSKNQTKKLELIKPMLLPQLTVQQLTQLNKAYAPFVNKTQTDKTQTKQGMSAAEQAMQQGELKSFFIGDNKLTLKAVIQQQDSKLIALIETHNIKSGESTVESFAHGSLVYGYKLVINKNTQVLLSKEQAEKPQQITLTMYTGKV